MGLTDSQNLLVEDGQDGSDAAFRDMVSRFACLFDGAPAGWGRHASGGRCDAV